MENSALGAISAENSPPIGQLKRDDTGISNAGAARERFDEDLNNFLTLLTTQLKNQDPTEPMDTNQFTEQLAILSSVEQAISTNENLETLVNIMQGSQISTAVSYIGKGVDAPGNGSQLKDGFANFTYSLPRSATEISATVMDDRGVAVFVSDGAPATSGRHDFGWNGIGNVGNVNGVTLPDGDYQLIINAQDANGDEITATTFTTGRVVAVESGDGGAMTLSLDNGTNVSLDDVLTVRELPPLAVATAAPEEDEG